MENPELSWSKLMSCFGHHCDPKEFYKSTFNTSTLQYYLNESPLTSGIAIPPDWRTTGYADEIERERYARLIAGKLAKMGVLVTGVPPEDRFRSKWGTPALAHS